MDRPVLKNRSIVDRYRIDALVDQGSVSTVYRVTHVWLHTPMILKHMHVGVGPDLEHAMWEEGRIQATRHHQNLVAVHDAFQIDGRPALVMELVNGPDLADWLDAREVPDLDEAVAIFRGILAGMEEAHGAGLVHRDLKPENVLLSLRAGQPPVPKVADFGMAKRTAGRQVAITLSGTYSLIGTPEYMAPEQLKDPGAVDHRADLFSLGAILYELATGQVAFEGEDLAEVLPKVTQGRYRPPREVRPEIPEALAGLIASLLQVERERRPFGCREVLDALDRAGLTGRG